MKLKIRTTLIAGATAALIAGPTWAGETPKEGAYTPAATKAELGQPQRDQPTGAQPMGAAPRMGAAPTASDRATTQIGNNSLYTRSADDLNGTEVVDSTGNNVGEIKQIVLAPDHKSAHAVISVGGFLGLGARDIMVSLDKLMPMDDKLRMSATKEDIAAMKDDARDDGRNADQYVEVRGEAPISGSIVEFSAFEQGKDANKPAAGSMRSTKDTYKPATAPETPKAPQ